MTDTVSIIRLKGDSLSVEAEKKRHSDWIKQEAQLLVDELFSDLHKPAEQYSDGDYSAALDVDWVDAPILASSRPTHEDSRELTSSWKSLEVEESQSSEDPVNWISQPQATPFYHRIFLVLGGLAIVTPLSIWGGNLLKTASQPKSVIAATPLPLMAMPSVSDQDFANYAEKALQQINVMPPQGPQAVGITTLPALKIGNIPSASSSIPPAPVKSPQLSPDTHLSSEVNTNTALKLPPVPENMNRLALRVFQPEPIQSAVPPLSSSPAQSRETEVSSSASAPQLPPNLSSITPAPVGDLPALSANITEPTATIAAATPMNSPVNASKKVIGIVELGLQSTLMVSNNGSHLNFQVGDTVDDSGWKLVQIAQGKAILQKGTEYKSLSEGQYF